ncbi:HAMP domain-containing sensor histidine kinase [Paenarthrobacter sp. PH39-S1]|uniref:sensor histidine kinase n=1 Tax=Paenarthrobacter sp. PH39-S1 TaxID=3046204 RepID=UPI0024B8B94B|nr:HAMP domain-containing sensor histidine kinase [Paenarthrobacter sp. PH39-S1]MDJ0355244.1 HAMP domain-containing sensor histidine kinase [Paenarthrobacter sp. PH39-S1]
MSADDLVTIVRLVVLWAVIIGAVTVFLQWLLRRSSIVVQICLVVVSAVGIMVAGMIGAFNAMFISAHDLEVMWYIVGIASVAAVAVAVVLGLGVARNTRSLVSAARSIGRGETVAPTRNVSSELTALASEMKSTSEKLEESRSRVRAAEAARRELVAWVSHDLRTPLASMRAMAEALEDGMATDVSAYHRKIIAQVDEMAVLVNDLLELSKFQAGTMVVTRETMDLYDLVSDAIADLAPLAERRHVEVNGDGVQSTLAAVDGASLGRAVRNVMMNALMYTRHGSTVYIAVKSEPGWATVVVEDACGGIPVEDLPKLFTTGWRRCSGPGRNAFSGAGVGLSLVAGIVQAHHGGVEVENAGDGCRFSLRIPTATAGGDGPLPGQ